MGKADPICYRKQFHIISFETVLYRCLGKVVAVLMEAPGIASMGVAGWHAFVNSTKEAESDSFNFP